jgi:hypothetical protein
MIPFYYYDVPMWLTAIVAILMMQAIVAWVVVRAFRSLRKAYEEEMQKRSELDERFTTKSYRRKSACH